MATLNYQTGHDVKYDNFDVVGRRHPKKGEYYIYPKSCSIRIAKSDLCTSYVVVKPRIECIKTHKDAKKWAEKNPSEVVAWKTELQFSSGWGYSYPIHDYQVLTDYDENGAVWTPLAEIECV